MKETPGVTCLALGETMMDAFVYARKRKPLEFSLVGPLDVLYKKLDRPKNGHRLVPPKR